MKEPKKVYSECGVRISAPEPRSAARGWLEAGRPVALATVIETWGSAAVRAGGQMAITSSGEYQGSVSGGCVEADVIAGALDVIATGKPQTLSFGVTNEAAQRAGLACGGQMRVFVSRLDPKSDMDLIRSVEEASNNRTAIVVATSLLDGRREIISAEGVRCPQVAKALVSGSSGVAETPDGDRFLHAILPTPRILVIGASNIGQHLATMAAAAGYDVKIIDPRRTLASSERFDPAHILESWPEQCFAKLASDPYAAVVTLTHVDKIDDEALGIALKSKCRYVGALGSRRTHAKRVERLKKAGFSDDDLERINAPVGLDIGAETPGEIAVSILAQIIAAFRKSAPV